MRPVQRRLFHEIGEVCIVADNPYNQKIRLVLARNTLEELDLHRGIISRDAKIQGLVIERVPAILEKPLQHSQIGCLDRHSPSERKRIAKTDDPKRALGFACRDLPLPKTDLIDGDGDADEIGSQPRLELIHESIIGARPDEASQTDVS